jgi:hypothetical protein
MERLVDLCRKVRSGAYHVKRGAIDWAEFPFDQIPRAIAVITDEENLLEKQMGNDASISLELFAKRQEGDAKELSDALQEELRKDAKEVVLQLLTEQDRSGDSVIFHIPPATARLVHVHDDGLKVQGIYAQFDVSF